MKALCKLIMKLGGWKFEGPVPHHDKAIILAVPHTSLWDWFWGCVSLKSAGVPTYILVKKEFFFFPLGYLMRALGAIPVDRGNKNNNMIASLKKEFDKHEKCYICIAAEGTRKLRKKWKKGFLVLANETGLPVYLGGLDYERKVTWTGKPFPLTGDVEKDLKDIQAQYKGAKAKHPELFSAGV